MSEDWREKYEHGFPEKEIPVNIWVKYRNKTPQELMMLFLSSFDHQTGEIKEEDHYEYALAEIFNRISEYFESTNKSIKATDNVFSRHRHKIFNAYTEKPAY